ncbi:MAG TPA: indolepyruvate oxidoreductase subunit beta family protein, partial [Roseiarcus sp.]
DFAARRTIAFDMEKLAVERGTMISAAMLGALAGSGALPFERSAYEDIVRKGSRGANASLAAFADAYDRSRAGERTAPNTGPAKRLDELPEDAGHPELNRLVGRLRSDLPESARPLAFAGLKRIVDFQDVAYGDDYIDRLQKLTALDAANGGAAKNFAFTAEAAKRLAVAMAYDDVIRVADIKLRPSRFTRLREEAGAAPDQLVYATEYLHPRGEEICGMMPASLGAFIEAKPSLFRALDRIVNRGRRVPVGRIFGFLQLYGVAALRRTRRSSLRHKRETAHLEAWLAQAVDILPKNYDLAVEILRCRLLVKGYSDTHARGFSKFDRVMAKAPKLAPREDGAQWMARLIAAALMDEPGEALDGVAKTVDTL